MFCAHYTSAMFCEHYTSVIFCAHHTSVMLCMSWFWTLVIFYPADPFQNSQVQCSAVLCSPVQCSAVQSSAVQCSAVQCSTVQYSAVQCSPVQSSAVQCSSVHRTAPELASDETNCYGKPWICNNCTHPFHLSFCLTDYSSASIFVCLFNCYPLRFKSFWKVNQQSYSQKQ